MLKTHMQSGAEVTIAAIPVIARGRSKPGQSCAWTNTGRVVGFLEKPQSDEEFDLVRMDPAWIDAQGIESGGRECLASMGIYVFNRDFLVEVLKKTSYQDFGKEVFPAAFAAVTSKCICLTAIGRISVPSVHSMMPI